MNRGGRPAKASQPADGEGGAAATDSTLARPRGRPRRPPPVLEDSRARPEEAAVHARLLKVDAPCLRNMCSTILPINRPRDGLPLARRQKQSKVERLMQHHERLAAVFTSDAPATASALPPLLPSQAMAPPATAPPQQPSRSQRPPRRLRRLRRRLRSLLRLLCRHCRLCRRICHQLTCHHRHRRQLTCRCRCRAGLARPCPEPEAAGSRRSAAAADAAMLPDSARHSMQGRRPLSHPCTCKNGPCRVQGRPPRRPGVVRRRPEGAETDLISARPATHLQLQPSCCPGSPRGVLRHMSADSSAALSAADGDTPTTTNTTRMPGSRH